MKSFTHFLKKTLFVIALCTFLLPSTSHAYTLDEAMQQIESLKAELTILRAQLGAQTSGTLSTCTITSFTATLPVSYSTYSNYHNLYWQTTGCTGVMINGVTQPLSGSVVTPSGAAPSVLPVNAPSGTLTYTLTATGGSNGTQTKSVTMYYPHLTASIATTSPVAQSIVQGATNVHLADFNLSLNSNVATQTLDTLSLTVWCTPLTMAAPLKNARLMIGGVQVAVLSSVQPCSGGYSNNRIDVASQNIQFASGEVKKVSLYADVDINSIVGSKLLFELSGGVRLAYSASTGAKTTNILTIASKLNTICTITSFVATPASIPSGGSSVLSWTTSGCDKVTINGAKAQVNGSMNTGPLTSTIKYTISAISSTAFTSCLTLVCPTVKPQTKQVTVTVATPIVTGCVINSFVTPAATSIASRLSIPISWSTNCARVAIILNSGSYYYYYRDGGSTGTYTFTAPIGAVYSTGETAVDVTLVVGDDTDTTSLTRTIPITDTPTPAINQCAITSLTATPTIVSSTAPQTTLSWVAPAGCIVRVESLTASSTKLVDGYISKPGAFYFNATDTITVAPTASTTYYVYAQAGATSATGNTTVLSVKTVDVEKK